MSQGVNPKDAIGADKPGLAQLPLGPIFEAGEVMKLGAEKYGAYNWRTTQVRASVYYDAILRHLHRWYERQDLDEESGCHHLAHIIANCALFMDARWADCTYDDRPDPQNPAKF